VGIPEQAKVGIAWLAGIVLVAGLLLAGACTHFTPYYRDDLARSVPSAEGALVEHRLILIGDAGDPDHAGEPNLRLLAQQVQQMPERTTVVFLGDNVYERGMPTVDDDTIAEEAGEILAAPIIDISDDREEAERQIDAQIDAVRGSPARAIFLPGNHDWDPFEVGGWERIRALGDFIGGRWTPDTNVSLIPAGGCPGPDVVPLGRSAQLIALDTQWWLETGKDAKPSPLNNPTGCRYITEQQVRTALTTELETARDRGRWAIVVGHHPLDSKGPHGGFLDGRTHVFPFQVARHYVPPYIEWIPIPVIGSLVVFARGNFSPSNQDMSNDGNEHMRDALTHAMTQAARRHAAPLVYAAGHDHSLQVFESRQGPRYTLVSGLGSQSRASDVGSSGRTLFAHANPFHPGFMQIDFLVDGSVRLGVLEWSADDPQGREVFSMFLADPQPRPGPL